MGPPQQQRTREGPGNLDTGNRMFKITKREMEWGGATLTLETVSYTHL